MDKERQRQERCIRQARWAAEYRDGLDALSALVDAPSVSRAGLRRRIRRGEQAIALLMADLDGLIHHVVRREFAGASDVDDLVQDGRVHALEMIKIWKPGHGASMSTWAVLYLPQALRRLRRKGTDWRRAGLGSLDATPELVEHLADRSPGPAEIGLGDTAWFQRDVEALCGTLEPGDACLIETLVAERGSELSATERGRARAILAHPAAGLTGIAGATGALDVDGSAAWTDRAACADMDVIGFFPQRGQATPIEAMQACAACPVRAACLASVQDRSTWPGLWGGTSAKQRRARRAQRGHDEAIVSGEAA